MIPITDIQFPPDAHIIAVHVRQGGGFDAPLCNTSNTLSPPTLSLCADKIWPTKFPPCDFYSNALNYLINRYPQQHLHVHIFTDAENPEEITKRVSKALPSSSLTFSYRKENNRHDSNVLEDLFAMARCDYLIRPQSSYSRVAQLIGDHRLIISPIKAVWKNNTLMVTEISIVSRN